jgi:beta-N-acetylhexosaminidase
VARHVTAFIEGARSITGAPVLTTVKHFPGHGDTAVDTHLNLAGVPGDRARLEHLELVPFRAAIQASVDAVMTAHLAVPALGVTDMPATLAPAVLTDLLRKELGFRGLTVTDALDMGGIAKGFSSGQAAVKALEAGADVLLMPPDPEEAVTAVVAAVRDKRIPERRIEESLARVLAAKEKVGLHRRRLVDADTIEDEVNAPESNEVAQQAADRAVTLVKNDRMLLPLKSPARAGYLLLAESRASTQGRVMADEIRRRAKEATVLELDPGVTIDRVLEGTRDCETLVAAAFSQVGAYRSNVQLAGEYPQLMEALLASGKPVAMVALGNPYLLRHYAAVHAYLATFSTVEPSEIAAVKAVFGEIDVRGRLPVTIPGLAKCGEGIQTARRS